MSGLPQRAAAGDLTALCGGGAELTGAAAAALRATCRKVYPVGNEVGHGQLAKALNNILYNISVAAMAEQLPLAAKLGLDTATFAAAVHESSGSSFGFNQWSSQVLARRFEAGEDGFPMGEAYKDFKTIDRTGEELGAVATAARKVYEHTLAEIDGAEAMHKGAMALWHEQQLGVRCDANMIDEDDN